jgi:putative heme-binding domain-containing protein
MSLRALACLLSLSAAAFAADAPPALDKEGKPLPAIAELAKMTGKAEHGEQIFGTFCIICHQAAGKGIDFGPNLSDVGARLPKEAIFQSIIDPNAVIAPGFEQVTIKLESEDVAIGIVAAETDQELKLKALGGAVNTYKKSDIVSRVKGKMSAMPVGLQRAMSAQDLVDLVTFLSAQKTKPAAK